jgi:chemotaxis protein methyltransferase CheR
MDAGLRENITFANHNLVTDGVFSEVHLILCRNVLIYFNNVLQQRVLGLFHDSLLHGGVLALGSKESLRHGDFADRFKELEPTWKVYRKSD